MVGGIHFSPSVVSYKELSLSLDLESGRTLEVQTTSYSK